MPGKRASLFPLLLPAVVCVPLAAVILFVLVGLWHGADARAAADARRADTALRAEATLENAVTEQTTVTGLLSRSTLVWLWVKFQGERLTASNRSHAEMSLAEIGNYARMVPGLTVYLASAKTGLLYRDGAPVRTLRQADAQDAWYFNALKTDALLMIMEGTSVRTSARLMDGGTLLGVVSCVRDASAIGSEIFPPTLAQRGITAALSDPQGQILAATAPGGTSARTVTALFPGVKPASVEAALKAAADPGAAQTLQALETRAGGSVVGVTVVHAAPLEGSILVALPVPADLSWIRILTLVIIPALSLGLILGSLSTLARRRMGRVASLLQHQEYASDSARTAFTRIDASARSAQSASVNLRALAGTISTEAAAGVASGAQAVEVLGKAEEQDTELRSGIVGRLTLMEELSASMDAALQRSRSAADAAQAVGAHAAKAEEELSRVITVGSSAASAVDKAEKGAHALTEASSRLNLIAMNAAVEAARAGASGQRLSRVAEDVKAMADDASSRAQQISSSLAEVSQGLAGASQAAQAAGKAVHDAGAVAATAAGASSAWEETAAVLSKVQAAGTSAARLRDQAVHADRGRSMLEGVAKIMARIRGLAGQAADLAGSVASDTESIARTAAAVMKEKETHD